MANRTKIVNLALRRLRCESISSLNDDNNPAKIMKELYADTRRWVLESHPWPFCIKRATLTADTVLVPAFEYTKQYALPADYLRAISEFNKKTFKREGDVLVGDDDFLELKYISDVTDESKFSPKFVRVLYLTLAKEAAYALTQDKALKQDIEVERENALRESRSYASQEGTPDDYEFDAFIDVRL